MITMLIKKIKSQWCKYSQTCLGTYYGGCHGVKACIFMKPKMKDKEA